ncbi:hypothetical protein [Rhodoblastus sp.]
MSAMAFSLGFIEALGLSGSVPDPDALVQSFFRWLSIAEVSSFGLLRFSTKGQCPLFLAVCILGSRLWKAKANIKPPFQRSLSLKHQRLAEK